MDIRPVSGALGAEVLDIDVRKLDDGAFAALRRAWNEHLVLFFPDQSLTPAEHRAFAARFGVVDEEPFVYPLKVPVLKEDPAIIEILKEASDPTINFGGLWHADVTYRERPHMAGVIYAIDVPAAGGDTLFANQYLAYETLSEGMKLFISGLKAIHTNAMSYGGEEARIGAVARDRAPGAGDRKAEANPFGKASLDHVIETAHPVVCAHPETGKKHLYVSRAFVTRFDGWTEEESKELLELLWAHCARDDFTCRYRWKPGTLGIWDNRAAQHFAANDYFGQRRHMHRIAVHGHRPV